MTQNQLIELLESEHVKALIERAEEHGGHLTIPEIEAFVLEHDLGEDDPSCRSASSRHTASRSSTRRSTRRKRRSRSTRLAAVSGAADSLQLFLADVGRHKLLTAAEEVALAKRIERGDPSPSGR